MMRLGAKELRTVKSSREAKTKIKKNPVYIILDNVMDTYNVGAIFRLAEAVAATCIYLCGATETPPNSRIKKASINTTEWVDWEYCPSAVGAISKLRQRVKNLKVVAVEQDSRSVRYDTTEYEFPIALVVGHESDGVSLEVLDMVDKIVEIPMRGVNKSLNVMVSLGIVLFEVMKMVSLRD